MSKNKQRNKEIYFERMKSLLGEDYEKYLEKLKEDLPRTIRVNTLKITPEKLKKKLESKNWKIKQPFKSNPEIMIVEGKISDDSETGEENNTFVNSDKGGRLGLRGGDSNQNNNLIDLGPGELGRALEHLLGYYYIQELSSMLPVIALNPKENETILDLCSAPGSKTTQIASHMKGTGTIIANEVKLNRIKILASNLERCGVSNTIITKKEGVALCKRLKNENFQIDKILVDAPCSGEGTIRSAPKTLDIWNERRVNILSNVQKSLLSAAIDLVKEGGEIVYSTCTHSPEENEEVINEVIKNHENIKIEKITLPVKTKPGLSKWQEKEYAEELKFSCRIYPQDNDSEGFFIAKLRKIK